MSNSKINNIDLTNAKRPKTKDIVVRDEYGQTREFPITGELPLTIFVNKKEIVTLMTLGHYPESLVIGYLRNQGFIESLDELIKFYFFLVSFQSKRKYANQLDLLFSQEQELNLPLYRLE